MSSIKPRSSRFGVAVIILITLSAALPAGAQAGVGPDSGHFTGDLPTSFTLTAVVSQTDPCPTLSDPTATEVVTVTNSQGVTVATSQFFYAGEPIYRKPASGDFKLIDYDERGNYLVWRQVEVRRLYKQEGNQALKTFRLYRVSPEGKVKAEVTIHTQLVQGVPVSRQGLSDADLVILALGQGFSRYAAETPRGSGASGAILKRGAARLAPAAAGTWELLPAAENDRLIREARFFGESKDSPVIEVKTRGIAKVEGAVLARQGEIRLGGADEAFGLAVELKSFVPEADKRLIAEVTRQITGPLVKGTEIMNMRGKEITRVFVDEPIPVPTDPTCCVCKPVTTTLSECGHLQTSTKCASDWCISNVVNSATCSNTAPSGVASCPIVSPVPVQPMIIQTPILLPNGGCPTGGNPVNYATKLTTYDGCTGCTPTSPVIIQTACDVASCPAGTSLDRCASPRGIRRACA